MNSTSRIKKDILVWGPVRALVNSAAFPVVFQAIALVVVFLLALNGLGIGADMKAEDLLVLRKTNLTTLFVWGLWWPGMIAVAFAFGRAWCTVCPMELVNRLGHTLASKLGLPRARLGKFLLAGWGAIVLYIVMQVFVAGISMHRIPQYTGILLLTLISGAFFSGMAFRQHRSFCKAFCPSSALLSVYGRYTPVQLEARDPSVCNSCQTKDCVRAENRERFNKRSYPSLLAPYQRDPSDGCVLCLQCVKACPSQNISVGIVASETPVRRKQLLRPFEAAFVMIALGFVTHEVVGEVKWFDDMFHVVPNWLNKVLPPISPDWFEALWFLVLFPLLVWAGISGIGHLIGYRGEFRTLLLAAATGAAPVVAVAHLAKAAAKMTAWGGFLPLALRDPRGIETFNLITDNTLIAPKSLLGLSTVGWVMLALTLVIAWKTWRWTRQIPTESVLAARAGLAAAVMLYGIVLTIWVWPVL